MANVGVMVKIFSKRNCLNHFTFRYLPASERSSFCVLTLQNTNGTYKYFCGFSQLFSPKSTVEDFKYFCLFSSDLRKEFL